MTTINDMIKNGEVYLETFNESKNRFDDMFKKEEKHQSKGKKYNEGKPMLAQFYKHFPNAYKAMVDNATYGFKKYKEDINDPNWKKNEIWEYEDALFRHFTSYLEGEKIDKESGKKHLAAVIWNACVLYELNEIKDKKDMVN